MRLGFSVLSLVIAGISLLGCDSEDKDNLSLQPIVEVTAPISTPTTWSASKVYVIKSAIPVTSSLTIEPGTVVKFTDGNSLSIDAGGTLNASGTTAAPCVFTSYKDDSVGGDTNADGAGSTPSKGDWRGIRINTDGTVIDGCRFMYGGSGKPYTGVFSVADDTSVTLTHNVFAHNEGGSPTDLRAAAVNLGNAGTDTVLTGNAFYDNDIPLVIGSTFDVDGTNTFRYVDGATILANTYQGIFWGGSYEVVGSILWSNTEVPYVLLSNPLSVPEGAALTVAPRVIVKFGDNQRLEVSGALSAVGATDGGRIVFTSFKDDSLGGDTNGDGLVSAAGAGDWGYLAINSSDVTLDHCLVRYAGSVSTHGAVGVAQDAEPTITASTFAYNAGGSPSDLRGATLNLAGAGPGVVLTDNTFYGNDIPLVINGLINVDDSNLFESEVAGVAVGNTYNAIFMDGTQHSVTGNVTWACTKVPFVLAQVTLSIESGASLALAANVVVKSLHGRIDVMGALAQDDSNAFTSFNDDTRMGDTNGDAAVTSPATGDWTGIKLCQQNPCEWADWTNIYYATNPV